MRLYALCDQSTLDKRGVSFEMFVALCRAKNAEIIQYRNKTSDIALIKSNLIALRKLWNGFLIVNDTYELAPYCDGIHLGQDDLLKIDSNPIKAIKIVRTVIGSDKIVGLSTHNEEEIAVANELELNYIGLGAYRSTQTKEVESILGDRLEVIAEGSRHPVAAIGGVRFDDHFSHVTYHVIGSDLYES